MRSELHAGSGIADLGGGIFSLGFSPAVAAQTFLIRAMIVEKLRIFLPVDAGRELGVTFRLGISRIGPAIYATVETDLQLRMYTTDMSGCVSAGRWLELDASSLVMHEIKPNGRRSGSPQHSDEGQTASPPHIWMICHEISRPGQLQVAKIFVASLQSWPE